ncbi:MAG: alpha/beta hydrolase [Microbacteriaceae bacterium]|nr:alpha/beta hydrolase [Microbacteriaceae bacterium]
MPRALLIHGLSNTPASMWRVQAWLEALGWGVHAHSPLGHAGRGPAPDYSVEAGVADALAHAPGPWDLVVGHSLGGTLATAIAARHPAWTRRLVVVDPPWYFSPTYLAGVREAELAELTMTRADIVAASPHWTGRDIDAKVEGLATVAPGAVAGVFDDNPDWDVRADAAALPVPTLLLTGDRSVFTLLDPADSAAAVAANPRITWVEVPGAGHAPHRDQPDATRAALLDWLAATAG